MAIIDYDKSPNISHEQRLQSLADSVRRAFGELKSITLEDYGGYPKAGGMIGGAIVFPNAKGICGMSADGTILRLIHVSGNDNLVIGYDGYDKDIGSTNIYGNDIKIWSKAAGLNGRQYGVNKVLASGASWMNDSQTWTLSEAISAQPNGIELVWSYYDGEAKSQYWNHNFIPKHQALQNEGKGVSVILGGTPNASSFLTLKYLYISDTEIKGYAGNGSETVTQTPTDIVLKPASFVLRYVLGV